MLALGVLALGSVSMGSVRDKQMFLKNMCRFVGLIPYILQHLHHSQTDFHNSSEHVEGWNKGFILVVSVFFYLLHIEY